MNVTLWWNLDVVSARWIYRTIWETHHTHMEAAQLNPALLHDLQHEHHVSVRPEARISLLKGSAISWAVGSFSHRHHYNRSTEQSPPAGCQREYWLKKLQLFRSIFRHIILLLFWWTVCIRNNINPNIQPSSDNSMSVRALRDHHFYSCRRNKNTKINSIIVI